MEFRTEIWAGAINLGINRILVELKIIRLERIFKDVTVQKGEVQEQSPEETQEQEKRRTQQKRLRSCQGGRKNTRHFFIFTMNLLHYTSDFF